MTLRWKKAALRSRTSQTSR